MIVISTTEFKNNFGKYVKIAQKESISVTKRGNEIFKISPTRQALVEEAKQFLDMLPSGATIGVDPYERG